jgi:short-subunit dehydrogenase
MRGLPARAVYGATKIALAYYFESLALEYPELGFTTIFPGFVDTPINRGAPNRLFVMGADRAARIMMRAVERGQRVLIYPWQIRALFHLARGLPFTWYGAAASRSARHRPSPKR